MPRILNDHFIKLASNSGPTRLDQSRLKEPERPATRWGMLIYATLCFTCMSAAWLGWQAGWFSSPESEEPAYAQPRPLTLARPGPLAPVVQPVLAVAVLAPVPVDAPAIDLKAIARQRAQLMGRLEILNQAAKSLNRELSEKKASIAIMVAQIKDADGVHWPKPGGPYTYERCLIHSLDTAKAKGGAGAGFKEQLALESYHDNRKKTLLNLAHERETEKSLQKRLDSIQTERTAIGEKLSAL